MLGAGTWTTARRITSPLALPARSRHSDRVPPAMSCRSPAFSRCLPGSTPDDQTGACSVSAQPELAAAASLPLLVVTVMLLRAQHMILAARATPLSAARVPTRAD